MISLGISYDVFWGGQSQRVHVLNVVLLSSELAQETRCWRALTKLSRVQTPEHREFTGLSKGKLYQPEPVI